MKKPIGSANWLFPNLTKEVMLKKKGKCCLLVEDDLEDQDFFIDALHHASSTTGCYAVSNGEEALSTLLGGFDPDFIVTDLNMPKMDGMEFLRNLRAIEKFRNIPVIVFSSDLSEGQIQHLQNLGVKECHSKSKIGGLKDILNEYFPGSGIRTAL